jgi:hypothetical protein
MIIVMVRAKVTVRMQEVAGHVSIVVDVFTHNHHSILGSSSLREVYLGALMLRHWLFQTPLFFLHKDEGSLVPEVANVWSGTF